jgi:hypothetical protein
MIALNYPVMVASLKPLPAESAAGEKLFFHRGLKGSHGKKQ